MDLLPKTSHEFSQTEYWNNFFKKRGNKSFDWYGEYLDLCEQLHKYIKPKDNILIVGCGNSSLSMDMYDRGFQNITNIDISVVAIKQMNELNKNTRPVMKFLQMDATSMSFLNEVFTVILDKGTLDGLMTDETQETISTITKYFNEICRVLRTGGRYVCISLLQEHILKFLLAYFPAHNCMFRVIRCFDAEQKNMELSSDDVMAMPVFIIVITKFKELPTPVLEICLGSEKMQRVNSTNEIVESITSIQKAALVCNGLVKNNLVDCGEIKMDLLKKTSNGEKLRYTVFILDQPYTRSNGKYAVFIVPQGREIEWMFATPEGRRKLLSSAKYNRLAIVIMHRDETYVSLDQVKEELNDSVRNFAPRGLKELIPYLTIGTDVGHRETLISGFSNLSGEFRIEEVEGSDGQIFRRLIFLSNQTVVQSEALVQTIKLKGNKTKKKLDKGFLACHHHLGMSIGVQMAVSPPFWRGSDSIPKNVLIIGLGGGSLCTFLHELLKKIIITAVEIDPIMLEVAEQFFELKQDDRFHVVIDDGIDFLERCANDKEKIFKFNAILFDVDSKDLTMGMSCPPKTFLESNTMKSVKNLLGKDGMFILNLVCRDDELRSKVIENMKESFSFVLSYKIKEDINEVIYCTNSSNVESLEKWKKHFVSFAKKMNLLAKETKLSKEEMVDVSDFLRQLKV